jgi:cytoskeletal protein RodZ
MTSAAEKKNELGKFLREVREKQGIGLEMVQEKTKIPLDVLRAIEEGYNVRTLTSFYRRGFLKLYAGYLKVDIRQYLQETKADPVKSFDEDFDFSLPAPQAYPWKKMLTPRRRRLLGRIILGVVAFYFVTRTAGCFLKNDDKSLQKTPQETAAPQQSMDRSIEAVPDRRPSVQTSDSFSGENQPVTLTVKALRSSWIQVKTDGIIVFQSVLGRGSTESWNRTAKKVFFNKEGLFVEE